MKSLPPPLTKGRNWPFEGVLHPLHPVENLPPLGIVTPSYNQGEYLEATIRSVLLQGYPHLEYYIEDGGSSDNSIKIIKYYEEFLSGWTSEKDRGQSHAINKGMAQLKRAEVVNWLNSDDYLSPDALLTIAKAANSQPDAAIFVGAARRIFPNSGKETIVKHDKVVLEDILHWHDRFLSQPATWFRSDLFQQIGGLREDLNYGMDFDMWIRMFNHKASAVCFNEIVVNTMHHEDSKTVSGRGRMHGECAVILMENGFREDAIRYVEYMHNVYHKDTRLFRRIDSTPFLGKLMNIYNKAKK